MTTTTRDENVPSIASGQDILRRCVDGVFIAKNPEGNAWRGVDPRQCVEAINALRAIKEHAQYLEERITTCATKIGINLTNFGLPS